MPHIGRMWGTTTALKQVFLVLAPKSLTLLSLCPSKEPTFVFWVKAFVDEGRTCRHPRDSPRFL
jgi:hypothetical protein